MIRNPADRFMEQEREIMIRDQLISRGIKDRNVLAVFRKVPRHLFVLEEYQSQSYQDHPIEIGEDQTISQPYMIAVMIELLSLQGTEKVLEIGTGSGYQTALLAEMAHSVYSVERLSPLYDRAKTRLKNMGYRNIFLGLGDGTKGWVDQSPYQGIIIGAAAPRIPKPLLEQLDEGGRLVLPLGDRSTQILTRVTKKGNSYKQEGFFHCVFVPLVGEWGWKDERE